VTSDLDVRIRRAVVELVDAAPAVPPMPMPPVVDLRGHRRPRRATTMVVAAVAVAVVLVAVGLFVLNRRSSDPRTDVLSGPSTSTTTTTKPPVGSAAWLAHGHWSKSSIAPSGSGSGSMVWTGKQVIVWGGIVGMHGFGSTGDGAAYDPETDTWSALPKAPISPRGGQAAVWTGSEMVIWGGQEGMSGPTYNDGAAFDPTTNTWRMLAQSPLPPMSGATALWDGHEVIVLGGQPQQINGLQGASPDVATYDPATDSWRMHAAMPMVAGHDAPQVSAYLAGTKILAVVEWQRLAQTHPELGIRGTLGMDLFSLDVTTGTWSPVTPPTTGLTHASPFVWTGTDLIGSVTTECGLCHPSGIVDPQPRPPAPDPVTYRFDPMSGVWTKVASRAGGVDADGRAPVAWTGSALVYLGQGLSAWDPKTDRWTDVPRPPLFGPMFWTGHTLVVVTWTDGPDAQAEPGLAAYRYIP
jgi:hypothetical protein